MMMRKVLMMAVCVLSIVSGQNYCLNRPICRLINPPNDALNSFVRCQVCFFVNGEKLCIDDRKQLTSQNQQTIAYDINKQPLSNLTVVFNTTLNNHINVGQFQLTLGHHLVPLTEQIQFSYELANKKCPELCLDYAVCKIRASQKDAPTVCDIYSGCHPKFDDEIPVRCDICWFTNHKKNCMKGESETGSFYMNVVDAFKYQISNRSLEVTAYQRKEIVAHGMVNLGEDAFLGNVLIKSVVHEGICEQKTEIPTTRTEAPSNTPTNAPTFTSTPTNTFTNSPTDATTN